MGMANKALLVGSSHRISGTHQLPRTTARRSLPMLVTFLSHCWLTLNSAVGRTRTSRSLVSATPILNIFSSLRVEVIKGAHEVVRLPHRDLARCRCCGAWTSSTTRRFLLSGRPSASTGGEVSFSSTTASHTYRQSPTHICLRHPHAHLFVAHAHLHPFLLCVCLLRRV